MNKFISTAAVTCAVGLYLIGPERPTEAAEKDKEKVSTQDITISELPVQPASTFFWGRGAFFGLEDRHTPQPLTNLSKWSGLKKMVLREAAGVGAAVCFSLPLCALTISSS
jgi:hypothetical protein